VLLSNIFCILKGPFQGNVNLPPFIFVALGIRSTNSSFQKTFHLSFFMPLLFAQQLNVVNIFFGLPMNFIQFK
jgi:hypothetical protein